MDAADVADRDMETLMQVRVANIRAGARRMTPTGYCFYCGEKLEDPRALFCDKDCAADYELEQKARERNGTK
jgi:hypothetical protein